MVFHAKHHMIVKAFVQGVAFLLCLCRPSVHVSAQGSSQAKYGVGGNDRDEICIEYQNKIKDLMLNEYQLQNGIEGGVIMKSDCKQLNDANVFMPRNEEEQKNLCENKCYAKLTDYYHMLYNHSCFDIGDENERSSAKTQALAYQIACQKTEAQKYCIPMLNDLVANAGDNYDLCSDIIEKMECCFESYKQFILLSGTNESINQILKAEEKCKQDGASNLNRICPCKDKEGQILNPFAFPDVKFCSKSIKNTLMTLSMMLTTFLLMISLVN